MRQWPRFDGLHQRACHAICGQCAEQRQLHGKRERERESSAVVVDDDANPFHPLQLSNMEVHSNGQQVAPVSEARANSADGFLEAIENYMRGHDVSLNLPGADAKITVSARNLANDELSLNLQLNDASDASDIEARGKKGNIFKKGGLNAASESIKPP